MALARQDIPNVVQHSRVVQDASREIGYLDAFKNGFEGSSAGLAYRAAMGEPMPDALPGLPTLKSVTRGAGALVGDFPLMSLGSAVGSQVGGATGFAAGGAVGTAPGAILGLGVGEVAGGGFGAMALPAAVKTALAEHIEKGNVASLHDLLDRTWDVLKESGKQGSIGAVTAGAGSAVKMAAVGPLALFGEKVTPGIAAAAVGTEAAAMTGAGAAAEGRLPTKQELIENALTIGGMHGANVAGAHLMNSWMESRRVESEQNFYKAMGQTAEASKLQKIMPEAHRDLMRQLTAGSPVSDVHVPIDKWDSHFQQSGFDPQDAAEKMGVSRAYTEAKATGGNVKVPLDTWIEKLVGTPHYKALSGDVKFSEEGPTLNQLNERAQTEKKNMQAAQEKLQPQIEADIKSSAQEKGIYADMQQRLKDSGVLKGSKQYEQKIKDISTLAAKHYAVEASRRGVEPQALYDQIKNRIQGPESTPAAKESPESEGLSQRSPSGLEEGRPPTPDLVQPSSRWLKTSPTSEAASTTERTFAVHPGSRLADSADLVSSPYYDRVAREAGESKLKFGESAYEADAQETHPRVMQIIGEQVQQRGLGVGDALAFKRAILHGVGVKLSSELRDSMDTVNAVGMDRLSPENAANLQDHLIRQLEDYHLVTGDNMVPKSYLEMVDKLGESAGRGSTADAVSRMIEKVDADRAARVGDREPLTGDALFQKRVTDTTKTTAFKKWFGKSQVRDEDGKPLVVFHGSGTSIEKFDYKFTDIGNDQLGSGFYFTTDESEAKGYTERRLDHEEKPGGEENPTVHATYLSIQHPLDAEASGDITPKQAREIIELAPDLDSGLSNWGDVSHEGMEAVMEKAAAAYAIKNENILMRLHSLSNDFFPGQVERFNAAVRYVLGYDGVKSNVSSEKTHYVAWFPEQVKAVDNRGTFDPKSRNIYEQGEGEALGEYRPQQQIIKFFKSADITTPPHELAHAWIEDAFQYVKSGAASDDYLKHWESAKDWLKISDDQDKLTREQHEKFAQGFEKYLMEGKAPSSDLKPIFLRSR